MRARAARIITRLSNRWFYRVKVASLTERATHAHPLHPAALASVPYGIVLIRVRVRVSGDDEAAGCAHGGAVRWGVHAGWLEEQRAHGHGRLGVRGQGGVVGRQVCGGKHGGVSGGAQVEAALPLEGLLDLQDDREEGHGDARAWLGPRQVGQQGGRRPLRGAHSWRRPWSCDPHTATSTA